MELLMVFTEFDFNHQKTILTLMVMCFKCMGIFTEKQIKKVCFIFW